MCVTLAVSFNRRTHGAHPLPDDSPSRVNCGQLSGRTFGAHHSYLPDVSITPPLELGLARDN